MKLAWPTFCAEIHPSESSTINTYHCRRLTRPSSEFGNGHGCLSPRVKTPNTHVVIRLVNDGGKVAIAEDFHDKRIRVRLLKFPHRLYRHQLVRRCFRLPLSVCGSHSKNHHCKTTHHDHNYYRNNHQDGFRHGHSEKLFHNPSTGMTKIRFPLGPTSTSTQLGASTSIMGGKRRRKSV